MNSKHSTVRFFLTLSILFIFHGNIFFPNLMYAQWVITPSQSITTHTSYSWKVDCDINNSHHVIVYGNQHPLQNSQPPNNVGTYLKIFDNNNSPITGDIYVFNQGFHTAFVELNSSNEVVVMGYNYNTSTSAEDLILKKYDINGNLMASSTVVSGIGSNFVDLTVMGNNDVLVSLFDNSDNLIIRCFDQNLIYKGAITVANSISNFSFTNLRSAFLDSYNNDFIVGYSRGNTNSTTSSIKKYSYNSSNPVASTHTHTVAFNGGFAVQNIGVRNSNQIALKQNGDIVYVDGIDGVMIASFPTYSSALLHTQQGRIKADEQNRLLLTWTTNQRGKAILFDDQNNVIHNYDEGGNITGYFSAAIDDCKFIFVGDDGKQGLEVGGPNLKTPFKQMFNCSDCDVSNLNPVANFVNHTHITQEDSFYGPGDVYHFNCIDDIILDASCTIGVTDYHLRIAEFDLVNWEFTKDFYGGWQGVAPSNNINIMNQFPPNEPTCGKIYILGYDIVVGGVWTSLSPPLFFTIDCEEIDLSETYACKVNLQEDELAVDRAYDQLLLEDQTRIIVGASRIGSDTRLFLEELDSQGTVVRSNSYPIQGDDVSNVQVIFDKETDEYVLFFDTQIGGNRDVYFLRIMHSTLAPINYYGPIVEDNGNSFSNEFAVEIENSLDCNYMMVVNQTIPLTQKTYVVAVDKCNGYAYSPSEINIGGSSRIISHDIIETGGRIDPLDCGSENISYLLSGSVDNDAFLVGLNCSGIVPPGTAANTFDVDGNTNTRSSAKRIEYFDNKFYVAGETGSLFNIGGNSVSANMWLSEFSIDENYIATLNWLNIYQKNVNKKESLMDMDFSDGFLYLAGQTEIEDVPSSTIEDYDGPKAYISKVDLGGNMIWSQEYTQEVNTESFFHDIELKCGAVYGLGACWDLVSDPEIPGIPIAKNIDVYRNKTNLQGVVANGDCHTPIDFEFNQVFPPINLINASASSVNIIPVLLPVLEELLISNSDCCSEYGTSVCCSPNEEAFCEIAQFNTTSNIEDCYAELFFPALDDCHQVTIDWGDGTIDGPHTMPHNFTHNYTTSGTYVICVLVVEYDADGNICYEKEYCLDEMVECETCCSPNEEAFCEIAQFNTTSNIEDCYAELFFPALDDCHQVTIDWGDGTIDGPHTMPHNFTHNYTTSGTYVICVLVVEYDADGNICYEKEYCLDEMVECETCCSPNEETFCEVAQFNTTSNIEDCYAELFFPALDDCHQVTIDWGDGTIDGPHTMPHNFIHNYTTSGIFIICVIVEEYDANGNLCYRKEYCLEEMVECSGCQISSTLYPIGSVADSCCFALDLNNSDPNVSKIQIDINTPNVFFDQSSITTGFNLLAYSPQSITIDNPPFIPTGTVSQYLTFCLGNTGNLVTSQSFTIKYFDVASNEIEECEQHFETECELPCTDNICVRILDIDVECDPLTPGKFKFTYKVKNETPNKVLDRLDFTIVNPSTGISLSSSSTTINPSIAPGVTSIDHCIDIFATPPFPKQVDIVFSASGYDINDPELPFCCHDLKDTLSITLPNCCDPCEDTWVVDKIIPSIDGDCCYSLDIINNCEDRLSKIKVTSLTGGVNLGAHWNPNYSGTWTFNVASSQIVEWMPIGGGYASLGNFPDLIHFCLDNSLVVINPQIMVEYIYIDSGTAEEIVECEEILELECEIDLNCIDIANHKAYCDESGNYYLDFCVDNLSTPYFNATELEINKLSSVPGDIDLAQKVWTGLTPSDFQLCRTVQITGIISTPTAGDILNLEFRLKNLAADTCCVESDTLSIVLPKCCTSTEPTDPNLLLSQYRTAMTCGVDTFSNTPKYTFGVMDNSQVLPVGTRTNFTGNALVSDFHHSSWHIDEIGNVFGITIDQAGYMYAAASANYGAGFWIYTSLLRYGNIGGGANDLAAAGTIYQMDKITGQASIFAQLPQQIFNFTHENCEGIQTSNRTTGPGLGNIVYDPTHDQMFAANWEDGRIYRLDMNGNLLDSYDPQQLDNNAAGLPSFATDVVPYGLGVNPNSTQLFFGTLYDGGQIYSIDLTSTGAFTGSVDNSSGNSGLSIDNYIGIEQLHHDFTRANISVSDLEFLPDGNLLVGTRSGCNDNFATSYSQHGSAYILTPTGGIYNSTPIQLPVSYDSDLPFNGLQGDDQYGGVAYAEYAGGKCEYVVSSSDILAETGPHGIAVIPRNFTGSPISQLAGIAYAPITNNSDMKGIGGDVQVFNPCSPFVKPVKDCCQSEVDFENRVDAGFTSTVVVNTTTVTPNNLTDCHTVTWIWGDGTPNGISQGNATTMHTYPDSNTYQICMKVEEYHADGDLCWEREFCDVIVSTPSDDAATDFKVYPNPAQNYLTFEWKNMATKSYQLVIFDLQGRIIWQQSGAATLEQKLEVDVNDFPTGMYGYHLQWDDGQAEYGKFIKGL